jgi:hypothetical protein
MRRGRGSARESTIGGNDLPASGIPWLSRLFLAAGLRLHDRGAFGFLHTQIQVSWSWRRTLSAEE